VVGSREAVAAQIPVEKQLAIQQLAIGNWQLAFVSELPSSM